MTVKVKFNNAAFRELLTSPGVGEEVTRVASGMAESAGKHFGWKTDVIGDRYMGIVFTASYRGRRQNAKENTLTKLMAGRW